MLKIQHLKEEEQSGIIKSEREFVGNTNNNYEQHYNYMKQKTKLSLRSQF